MEMKRIQQMINVVSATQFYIGGSFTVVAQMPATTATNLVRMPKSTHVNEALPDGILT